MKLLVLLTALFALGSVGAEYSASHSKLYSPGSLVSSPERCSYAPADPPPLHGALWLALPSPYYAIAPVPTQGLCEVQAPPRLAQGHRPFVFSGLSPPRFS